MTTYGIGYCARLAVKEWPRRERRGGLGRQSGVGTAFVREGSAGRWYCGGCGQEVPRPVRLFQGGTRQRVREVT